MHPLLIWLRSFAPTQLPARGRDLVLCGVGAAIGLLICEAFSHWGLGELNPWFIAPMGASSVLLFAVPASPLAQPWAIIGGNGVSALAGVLCAQAIGHNGLAAALAGGGAIMLMMALRCLHPPGGAVALTAVVGGPAIAKLGLSYVWAPVLFNSLALAVVALVYNNLIGRRYPHQAQPQPGPHRTADPLPSHRLGVRREDILALLREQDQRLDISPADLEDILVRAEQRAVRHKFGDLLCGEIMSRDVVSIGPRDTVEEAWVRLGEHSIKALPVVRDDGTLAGIVSLHDFFVAHGTTDPRQMPVMSTARHVQDIMTRRVRVARPEQPMVDLVALFSDGGLHHLPVVDDQLRVVGMITQSDMVAALFRTHSTDGSTPPPATLLPA